MTWGKLKGWFGKVEVLLHINQIICQNNHQNTVFVSGALYDEIIIRNSQVFEKMRGPVGVRQQYKYKNEGRGTHSAKGINSAMIADTNMMAIKAIDCWL